MGMDAYLFAAHSKKELQNEHFWNNIPKDVNEDEKWRVVGEKWYARKFWDLHEEIVHECLDGDYECGDWVELERSDIEIMIKFAIHHPDYWGGFKSVPDLCEIWYHWDELKSVGLNIYYECDW